MLARRGTWALAGMAPALLACGIGMTADMAHHDARRRSGTIVRIDETARTLTLREGGRRHRVGFDAETRVRRGVVDATVTSLRQGERVVVSMRTEGPARARIIAVANPAPAAGAARVPGVPGGNRP